MFSRTEIRGFWEKSILTQEIAAKSAAKKIISLKNEYDAVHVVTKVPWYVLGAIHMRESSFSLKGYLGNGDPLNKKTTHVPKGRGPFKTWYDGAIDSIHISKWDRLPEGSHWDIVTCLMKCEAYNGMGYSKKGLRSPYVWAGTNMQQKGKYVADGKFDSTVLDKQLGCAAVFLALKNFHDVELDCI